LIKKNSPKKIKRKVRLKPTRKHNILNNEIPIGRRKEKAQKADGVCLPQKDVKDSSSGIVFVFPNQTLRKRLTQRR
jgi:hypothetical protein